MGELPNTGHLGLLWVDVPLCRILARQPPLEISGAVWLEHDDTPDDVYRHTML